MGADPNTTRFATSVMMMKGKTIGFNWQMVLAIWDTANADEARGKAVADAMAKFPEHSVEGIALCQAIPKDTVSAAG